MFWNWLKNYALKCFGGDFLVEGVQNIRVDTCLWIGLNFRVNSLQKVGVWFEWTWRCKENVLRVVGELLSSDKLLNPWQTRGKKLSRFIARLSIWLLSWAKKNTKKNYACEEDSLCFFSRGRGESYRREN